MAITVKHSKTSLVADAGDATLVQPSDWNSDHTITGTIPVANGGTGVATLTGYVKGNGTADMTAASTIPNTDITGLGTASTKNAGSALGVATLDASGKVPVSELPAAVLGALSYQGTWNASTNSPTLTSSVGTKGYYYVVSVAGNTDLNGITDWLVGDWAVYNGTAWQKVDNTDAGGDVVGPASATDNAVARFDTTTGKLIQNSATTIDDSGILSTAKGLIGTNANFTDFPNAQFVGSQANTGSSHIYNIGVAGEGSATDIVGAGQWGVGVYGTGATAGATRGIGVVGDGHVGNTADTAAAIGVRGYATNTHSGGQNIGLYSQATGGASNYSLFMASGNIYSAVTQTWQIPDNETSALSLFSSGKAGIFTVKTTDGSEGISTSGTLDVAGTATANLFSGSGASLTNVVNSLTASTGISVSGSTGAVTVTNTAPDQTVAMTSGAGISVTGTYPNFTVTNTAPSSGGTVTSVTGTAPVVSSGGNNPAISMAAATGSVNGYLTSTDWTTFNNKGSGTVTAVSVASANGFTGTSSGGATPALTLTTSITGMLKGNGTAISAGTAGSDYVAPATATSFTAQQYFGNVALTDAATITWAANTAQVATFTFVSSNRTMGAPTGLVNGAYYGLAVIQNGGSNTLTWNSVFKWAGGTAPTLSTAAGAKDYFVFRTDGTNMYEQGRSLGVA